MKIRKVMGKIPKNCNKYDSEKFRKIVENECFVKISHFLIEDSKSVGILRNHRK